MKSRPSELSVSTGNRESFCRNGIAVLSERTKQSASRLAKSVLLAGTALFLAFSVPSSPAHAFEIFGLKFFEPDRDETPAVEDPFAYTADLTVTGTADSGLEETLRSRSGLVSQVETPPSGVAGMISRALSDRERLIGQLYSEGYYGGTVNIRLNGTPLETALETGSVPGASPAKVAVSVDPGPQFQFGDVSIQYESPDGAQPDLPQSAADWGLRPGAIAKSGEVRTAEGRLTTDLRDQGYPKARIAERIIVADHATKTLDVTLKVVPGSQAHFGPVSVSGTEVTDPDFVATYAMLPEGARYSPEELEKARKRLNELGIFGSVRFVEGDEVGPDGSLPVTIEVTERKRHVIGAGASWSSSEGVGLEAYWRRRNLFGRGELLSVEGSVGRIGNNDIGQMEYSARVAFEKPGAFGPLTKFTTSLTAKQENPDAYTSRWVTYDAYYHRRFSEQLNGRLGAAVTYANEEDVFGNSDYLLVSTPGDLTWDTRDDKLNPTKGIFSVIAIEPAYDTLQQNAMLFVRGTASSYVALDDAKRFVLAGKVSAGSVIGPDIQDIPANRRFIAGGGGSIRGYAYRNVGPRVNGEIVGGRSLVELSGEVRIKVTDTIGIVGFVDAGNAYEDEVPDFSEPFKIGVGAGIRYFTPIGPLRVDAAIPLDPGKDDPDFALYVGLSQAF
ncbi:autotransporter assembly complex protein TamA [Roseibium sediminis]|uniref:autotransporter assembly complex protein TamA n=1 Tax=Roseibium sediminis TaxID=1775174 RepID=UPI001AD946CB|nr:autotransporter assembly complex family protein [Roseibium sediminis]